MKKFPILAKLKELGTSLSSANANISSLNDRFTDMGSFSASTVTEFMTSVLSAMSNSNYPNGRYVVNATWQSQSVYVIVANKLSNTRIIGNATPQMQNGKDMIAFSLEGTTVNIYPLALNSSITQISKVTVTGTTSSGGSISSGLLNKTIIGAVLKDQNSAYVCLASYSASGVPWITVYSNNNMAPAGNKSVSIDVYYIDS